MKTLYQEVETQLSDFLPLNWGFELRRRLLTLVMGIILSESCSPRKIAKAIYRHGYSRAKEESIERQIRRIENDERLTAEACVHPLARHYLRLGKPKQLTLIIDATTHSDKIVLLMISVRYRGRALPLVWDVWQGNKPLKGAGFWERIEQLLQRVAQLLPAKVSIVWLADRAFGTPRFTDLLVAHGWHFIVRVQGQTRFADVIRRENRVDQLAGKKGRFKGTGKVFKSSDWRNMSVVILHRSNCKSPLCLVTDLPAEWTIAHHYRLRYNIEAKFRDYKSHGWHWEHTHVHDLDHTQRLLVGMALATWLTLMVGTQVASEQLQKVPTGKRYTPPPVSKMSLFQLGLERLRQWAVGNFRHILAFWLDDWHAPNWQDQITRHHLHAFVMGTTSSVVKVQQHLYSIVRP